MRPLKRQMKNRNNIVPQGKIKKQEDKQEKTSMHDLPTLFVKESMRLLIPMRNTTDMSKLVDLLNDMASGREY